METHRIAVPKDRLAGLQENWKTDLISGFIIFLIALPLCLGIAMASGVPPLAGIIAAVVGGILVSQISGSYVTINGPAAGLIVVILGAVESLGGGDVGYHAALAAIVVSGCILFVLGMLKAGLLGDFFPSSAVHGMLAAIGIIIMSKQLHIMLGVKPQAKEPLALLAEIPKSLQSMNPEIAVIGFVSLALLIVHSLIKNPMIKRVPAPLIVVVVAIVLGYVFDLDHFHVFTMSAHHYNIDPKKYLVLLPANVWDGITHPDFSKVGTYAFWLAVLSITLVQGLESLLSAAAVDKLDPYKRQSNLSRDMAAVGLGSAVSGMLGGLPMIAEIVRSSANVDNGARTRWSNFFHGSFMLVFVALGASLIHHIPLAALAGLLVFTGFRLASPAAFLTVYKIGKEQFVIFLSTILATLATDLLIGISVGIAVNFLINIAHGAPLRYLFAADVELRPDGEDGYVVQVKHAAVFSNYISIKRQLDKIPPKKKIVVDLSGAGLVDHSVMEHLHHYERDYTDHGGKFAIVGLEGHEPSSAHPLAARRMRTNGAVTGGATGQNDPAAKP